MNDSILNDSILNHGISNHGISNHSTPSQDSGETERNTLLRLTAPTAAEIGALRNRLALAADREGILDVAYTTVDTPVGPLLLAATERGLVRVAFEREGHDQVLQQLAAKVSPRIVRAPQRLDAAARQITEYFAGSRTKFDLGLDFALSGGFREQVQRHLTQIGYGHTESYRDVARIVGNPRAVRAVGTACATNPLPVVVPCHRVLRADGGLGGYIGGLAAKTSLLALESATVAG